MLIKTVILCACLLNVCGSGIYHENTKVLFKPVAPADYFGYSVILNHNSIIVGAPKSSNRANPQIASGQVFNCSLLTLDSDLPASLCSAITSSGRNPVLRRFRQSDSFFKDDMWFGASIASLTNEKIIICAPRFTEPYRDRHLLAHGACFLKSQATEYNSLYPLSENNRQAFLTDGRRPEYGDYGTHLNFFAYGQAGMSVKAAGNGSIIIGAPGLLQWTGGIIHYKYDKATSLIYKDDIINPYYTKDLGPDEYFGYSVDSGVFQPNGRILFVGGAPRSRRGYGLVLIFNQRNKRAIDKESLDVLSRIRGPQLGAYFGASLCCVDIDGDGAADLLVGAPNYVNKDGGLPFDQGAVFVYITKQKSYDKNKPFILEQAGEVTGSGASGARFGTAIANLGDVDGDGFNDVAIAAPWENEGSGAVYIYRGTSKGLKTQYIQKLVAEGAHTFGISLSNGMDVDYNNCNDLAIGAAESSSVYLYRCVPTIEVKATIKVPDAMDLPHNATGFSALFCVIAEKQSLWPHVKAVFKTRIVIDPEDNRADISGDAISKITVSPGNDACNEQTVEVRRTADLSKPITIKFFLEPEEILKNDSKEFNHEAARVSEDSVLHSLFLVQLTRDCGEDKICTPWLVMTLDSFDNPYIPGSTDKLGIKLTIKNEAEPAYGAKVNITLPASPKRLPSPCSLDNLVMTCDVPAPLYRNEEVSWDLELEYKTSEDNEMKFLAVLHDPLYSRNISDGNVKELVIEITPEARFDVNGKPLPNDTITITREKLYEGKYISFTHSYEITNFGPSDWLSLDFEVILQELAVLSSEIKDCYANSTRNVCNWNMPARDTRSVNIPLLLDLDYLKDILIEKTVINVTTEILLDAVDGNKYAVATTTFVLEPAPPIWPWILATVAGLIVLSVIVYLMHRYGFFSRQKKEQLKQLQEQTATEMEPGSSSGLDSLSSAGLLDNNDSTRELISDDSD